MEIIELIEFKPEVSQSVPLFSMSVSAGAPAPVEDEIESEIDLNEFLVERPATTFFAKVKGSTLPDHGLRDGDVLIVDKSIEPKDGKIVVASLNEDLTVKIYREIEGEIYLQSGGEQFVPMRIEPYMEFEVLGVVTRIIHSFES